MQKNTMATPPPPPPPASPPTSASKINRKTMIALGAIVIIVIAIVGVILATHGGGGNVADASSLQYTADFTASGVTTTFVYSAKNIGTSNLMLCVNSTTSEGNTIVIINGAQKQAWMCENGEWTNFSDYFTDYWNLWNSTFTEIRTNLSHWSGSEDYTYTDPSTGDSVRIYNISVNPSLPDSLFEHS